MTQVDQTTDYINAVFVNVSIGVLREDLATTNGGFSSTRLLILTSDGDE